MWWFAAPVAIFVAKKIYDAVTDDSSSSSSSSSSNSSASSSRSDNSAQLAHQAREAEAARAKKAREQRLHEQTELMVYQELKAIRKEFLQDTQLPTRFSQHTLESFTDQEIICQASAEKALSILCEKPIKLKPQTTNQAELDAELAGLKQLEQLIKQL